MVSRLPSQCTVLFPDAFCLENILLWQEYLLRH